MAIKPTKPNETGGKKPLGVSTGGPMPPKRGGFIPRTTPMGDDGLRKPLLKSNIKNAPGGTGLKVKAVKANGGLGGGNNLTPAGKVAVIRRNSNKTRMR